MPSFTTSLITAGPKSIAPWGDRKWRIALSAQYVSGSSSDYWLVTPTNPANHAVDGYALTVPQPDHEGVLDSLIYMLAIHLGDDDLEGYLFDHHNIEVADGLRVPVDFWELTESTRQHLGSRLASQFRLAVTVMDEICPVDPAVVRDLRALGFDVDVYTLLESCSVA